MEHDSPAGVEEPFHRRRRVQEGLQVRAGHDAQPEEGRLVQLGSQLGAQRLLDPSHVDRFGADRSPAGAGSGQVALNVGDPGAGHELQRGVVLEERHHVPSVLQQRLDSRFVVVLTERVFEIGAGRVDVLDDPVGLGQRVQRHPHPAARPGCGPAEDGRLLGHDDLQAVVGRRHRARQSGRASTDHQQIAVEVLRLPVRRHDTFPAQPRLQITAALPARTRAPLRRACHSPLCCVQH